MRKAMVRQLPPLDYAGTEALNTICTNLSFAGRDMKKIIFTSSDQGDGKSFLIMHILQNMARRGRRVVLVDADLRRSSLVQRYGMEAVGGIQGLAHYLAGQCELESVVYETNLFGACMIPAGRDISNPLMLLDSPYFSDMLTALAASFDMVLVDAPPVGLVIDAAVMGSACDGCVLVVQHNKTRLREASACKRQMEQAGCRVLGAVLNQVNFDTLSAKKYFGRYTTRKYDTRRKRRRD